MVKGSCATTEHATHSVCAEFCLFLRAGPQLGQMGCNRQADCFRRFLTHNGCFEHTQVRGEAYVLGREAAPRQGQRSTEPVEWPARRRAPRVL